MLTLKKKKATKDGLKVSYRSSGCKRRNHFWDFRTGQWMSVSTRMILAENVEVDDPEAKKLALCHQEEFDASRRIFFKTMIKRFITKPCFLLIRLIFRRKPSDERISMVEGEPPSCSNDCNNEERRKGIASFRMNSFGEL